MVNLSKWVNTFLAYQIYAIIYWGKTLNKENGKKKKKQKNKKKKKKKKKKTKNKKQKQK